MALGAYASGRPATDKTIVVTINHSRFEPGEIAVAAGQRIEFVIVNNDPIAHEFIVGDRGVQRRHENGTEAEHHAIPTEVTIPAGETVTTTIDFDYGSRLSRVPRLLFGCHLPGHFDYGMKGIIRVD